MSAIEHYIDGKHVSRSEFARALDRLPKKAGRLIPPAEFNWDETRNAYEIFTDTKGRA